MRRLMSLSRRWRQMWQSWWNSSTRSMMMRWNYWDEGWASSYWSDGTERHQHLSEQTWRNTLGKSGGYTDVCFIKDLKDTAPAFCCRVQTREWQWRISWHEKGEAGFAAWGCDAEMREDLCSQPSVGAYFQQSKTGGRTTPGQFTCPSQRTWI